MSKPLKVLFINRPKNLWIGGDYIQMEKTANELGKLGVDVWISETPLISPAIRMREFDIVHIFNFPMIWAKYGIWCGKKWGKKVVCSMIYHDIDKFVPFGDQQVMLDNLDAAIFLAGGELERVNKNLKINKDIINFVPNGIDDFWFQKPRVKQQDFILTVGRLDGTKGQLELAIACAQLGLKLVCAGERNDETYAKACEECGAELTGALKPEDLIKLYASCKVFALNSKAEVMPLTVMEAMAQGKPIVLSHKCEFKFKNVIWCNTDTKSVKKAISEALETENSAAIDEVKGYKWSDVAKQIKAIYEGINT